MNTNNAESANDWFRIENVETLDSPSLLIYASRARRNIQTMIERSGGVARLMPHVKTNKMPAVVEMMLEAGITHFKCATIAEAEMLALSGARWALIAHQLVPPKTARLLALQRAYPAVFFASLLDNMLTAERHSEFFTERGAVSEAFLDVDNGMNRSGAPLRVAELCELYQAVAALPGVRLHGLHVYDGHIRDEDFTERRGKIEAGFAAVEEARARIEGIMGETIAVVAGGTPAFSTHSARADRWRSPGTCVLWDWGYETILPEQNYEYAALALTRIISKPQRGFITLDLGHKAIAAENPIERRARFLNVEGCELESQSEEHGVARVRDEETWERLRVGDALYAAPYHVCPTVHLYDEAYWIEDAPEGSRTATGTRKILGRTRRITV